ncbi:MAG: hypothetical protein H5T66_07345 [Chloroflexi bacterium]|nr:hypothetical protein [Chloroflexota bacterium]
MLLLPDCFCWAILDRRGSGLFSSENGPVAIHVQKLEVLLLGNLKAQALHVLGIVVNLVEGIIGKQPENEDGHVPVQFFEHPGKDVAGGVAEVTDQRQKGRR